MNVKKLIATLVSFSMLIGFSTILSQPAKAATVYSLNIQYGSVTINGNQIGYHTGPGQYDYIVNTLAADDEIVIGGSGNYGIDVIPTIDLSTFNIKLKDVNINTSGAVDGCAFRIYPDPNVKATVNLKLEGNNTLKSAENHAGIEVPETAVLNFANGLSNATLNVTGGKSAAGIGGGNDMAVGEINIDYYNVTSNGGDYGAGIGGGWKRNGGTTTINGGNITTTGGYGGAGIGGGDGGSGGIININNGNITAMRKYIPNIKVPNTYQLIDSACIGGGDDGAGGTINISGGTILAKPFTGDTIAQTTDFGTGIGGGWDADGGTINITGGDISVQGLGYATGIGGGYGYSGNPGSGGNITISNANIYIETEAGVAIGGGGSLDHIGGAGGNIKILSGYIEAKSRSATAIGGGMSYSKKGGAGANLKITGGTVIATGYNNIDIGYGVNSDGKETHGDESTCTIDGGSVSAKYFAPIPSNTAGAQVYLTTVTIPGITSPTAISYYIDPAKQYSCQTDNAGRIFLWLPATPVEITILKSGITYIASDTVKAGVNSFNASIPLHVPTIALSTSQIAVGGLDYAITPVSSETAHVSNYLIQLYDETGTTKVGSAISATALTGNIPLSSLTIGTTYKASVHAVAVQDSGYINSDTSALSAAVTPGNAKPALTAPKITLARSDATGGLSYTITPFQAEAQLVTSYSIQLYNEILVSASGAPITVSAALLTGTIPLSTNVTAGTEYSAKIMAVTNSQERSDSLYSSSSNSVQAAAYPVLISGTDGSQLKIETGLQPDGTKLVEVGVPGTVNGGLVTGSVTDVGGMLSPGGSSSGVPAFQFNMSTIPGATGATLSFTGTSFDQLALTGGTLTFRSQFGSLNFNSGALGSIAGAGNSRTVSMSLEELPSVILASGPRPTYGIGVQAGGSPITSFGGATIEFSLPYTPQAGEDPNALVPYYLGPNGNVPVRGFFGSNTVSGFTNHLSEYFIGYNKVTFEDVPKESWYYNAVTFIAAREITKGTGSGLFSPEKTLTRGEFLTMLLRAYCIEPDADLTGNFSDAGNSYYTGYLAAAKRLGIAKGAGDNKFVPEKELTRQDMFTLLYRALTVLDPQTAVVSKNTMSSFNDASLVSDYAQDAVKSLVENGIISGSNGKINPAGLISRAEMAQALYKLLSQ